MFDLKGNERGGRGRTWRGGTFTRSRDGGIKVTQRNGPRMYADYDFKVQVSLQLSMEHVQMTG